MGLKFWPKWCKCPTAHHIVRLLLRACTLIFNYFLKFGPFLMWKSPAQMFYCLFFPLNVVIAIIKADDSKPCSSSLMLNETIIKTIHEEQSILIVNYLSKNLLFGGPWLDSSSIYDLLINCFGNHNIYIIYFGCSLKRMYFVLV